MPRMHQSNARAHARQLCTPSAPPILTPQRRLIQVCSADPPANVHTPSRQTDAVSVRAPAGPRDAPPTSSVSCAPVVYASTATWQGQALLRTGLLDRPTRAEPQQVDIMYTPTIDPIRSGFFCLFVVRPTRSPCMCVYARARVLQLQP